jgi:AcrR family transcriptional regulator
MTDLGEPPRRDAAAANGRGERRGYHHGHLREALIAATKDLLAQKGPQGFTLADAARVAGVSPAAPYRHFADRDTLLRAVANAGFQAFGAALSRATRSDGDAQRGFRAMGDAYLRFAREEPGYYIAMFSAPLAEGGGSETAGSAAFEALIDAIAAALAARAITAPDLRNLALQIWSLSHGVATLAAAGRLHEDCADAEEILASGVNALLEGAGREGRR